MYRYGGEVSALSYHKARSTGRVPTLEEIQRFQSGNTNGYEEREVIELLLNYIQRLESMLDGHDQ